MLALIPLLVSLECLATGEPAIAKVTMPDGAVAIARPGLLAVAGRRFTPCDTLPSAQPTALAVHAGALYVGFRSGGVYRLEGNWFNQLSLPSASPVRALSSDGKRLYVGTAAGLVIVDERGARRSDHPVLRRREITALAIARDGAVHVGAGAYGWWRIDGARTRLQRAVYAGCFVESRRRVEPRAPGPGCAPIEPGENGLASGHVTALAHFDGHLWVGTFDRGLFRRQGPGWQRVDGVPPFVNALVADGSRLWVGTAQGLFAVGDDQSVTRVALGAPGHVNGLMLGSDGVLHVATSQGLVELSGSTARVVDERSGLPSRIVYAVAESADGAVWAGTAGGVARFSRDGVRVYTQASGALPHDWVTALLPDGDAMLAGTYDAGVARLGADGRGRRVPGLERAWVNPNGLARIHDRLLVMTLGDGLLVAERGLATVVHLPANDVTSVLSAGDGDVLFVGTRAGLVRARFTTPAPHPTAADPIETARATR